MGSDPASCRSSALLPDVELWPSEWSALNRTLLMIPKEVPLLRYLRVRPLAPKHREGLRLLHMRLFPIHYDSRFYDVVCGLGGDSVNRPKDIWSNNDLVGIGLFLPRGVLLRHCDCNDVICCTSCSSSVTSEASQPSSPSSVGKSSCSVRGDTSCADYIDSMSDSGSKESSGSYACAGAGPECILNDATYDRENDEFLVGFATMLLNYSSYSDLVPGEDYFWLESFFEDMMVPFFEECDSYDTCFDRFLNFDVMPADFYRFLYTNLYRNDVMLDYLSRYNIGDCKTVYLLSAGITMGLRSRLLGTHLILFVQCMVYYCAYGVFIYNRDLYFCSGSVRDAVLARLDLHLSAMDDAQFTLELDETSESEVSPFRLSLESVVTSYRRCEEMPITIYLHVIEYNKKACATYRRTKFVRVTRYDDYYTINAKQYAANVLAYYVYPPCGW